MKALAKDPLQRFASVEDFAKALEEASEAQPASTIDIIEVRSGTEEQAFYSVQEKVYPQAIPAQTTWDVPLFATHPIFPAQNQQMREYVARWGRRPRRF